MQSEGGGGLPNRTLVHMPCLSILGGVGVGVGWRSLSRVDGEGETGMSEYSVTDRAGCKSLFDQSEQHQQKKTSEVTEVFCHCWFPNGASAHRSGSIAPPRLVRPLSQSRREPSLLPTKQKKSHLQVSAEFKALPIVCFQSVWRRHVAVHVHPKNRTLHEERAHACA